MRRPAATARADALVGCGQCGVGVLDRAAPGCPLQPHPLCADCLATVQQLIANLRAHGQDPLAARRRRKRR